MLTIPVGNTGIKPTAPESLHTEELKSGQTDN